MTSRREDFHKLARLSGTVNVVLADKSVILAVGIGTVQMLLRDSKGKTVWVEFKNVLYVPDLQKRLISMIKGAEITFEVQKSIADFFRNLMIKYNLNESVSHSFCPH